MKCKTGVTLNPEMRRRVTELLGETSYKLLAAPNRALTGNNGRNNNGNRWPKRNG